MEIKEKFKIEREEEKITKAFCDFCKTKFSDSIVHCGGYGRIRIGFGYESCFDDDYFCLDICDKCFIEKFGDLLEKQLIEKGYNIKSIYTGLSLNANKENKNG